MAIFTGAGVAIVTPFNDDEERSINYDKLDALLDYHCNNGTDCSGNQAVHLTYHN